MQILRAGEGDRSREAKGAQWFISIDPLAEKYYSISPYAYCLNNPIKYTDPDGRNPIIVVAGVAIGAGELALISMGVMTTGYLLYRAQNGNISFTPRVTNMFSSTPAPSPSTTTNNSTKKSPELSNQEKRDKAGKAGLDQNQANVEQTVVNGGHNPKDPGGDFNPKNPKPSTVAKAVGLATAGAVLVEQISTGGDDSQETQQQQSQQQQQQQSQQQQSQQQKDPSTWDRIKNFFNW